MIKYELIKIRFTVNPTSEELTPKDEIITRAIRCLVKKYRNKYKTSVTKAGFPPTNFYPRSDFFHLLN